MNMDFADRVGAIRRLGRIMARRSFARFGDSYPLRQLHDARPFEQHCRSHENPTLWGTRQLNK